MVLIGVKKTNWQSSGIALILKNEKYMGNALLQKTYTVDFLNKKRIKNNGIMPPILCWERPFYYYSQVCLYKSTEPDPSAP